MLQLLQPLWLFTLTGISIPVIIHLWNRRPGKILKVGSISLFTENPKTYKKSFTLSDILLLIIRCLLLALLSLTLAKPVWQTNPVATKQKGWVLISSENLSGAYSHFGPVIDSLLRTGMEFHYFNAGFQKDDFPEALKNRNDTNGLTTIPYWSLLTALNETVSLSRPLYLFTDNYLKHFKGSRPVVSLKLKWFVYTPRDTATQEMTAARKDSSVLRVTLVTGKNTDDARYLESAIDAIQQFSKKNIQLSVTGNPATIPMKQDWVFWLSDELLPKKDLGKNIFIYEKGKVGNNGSQLRTTGSFLFAPVAFYKFILPDRPVNSSSRIIWQDGNGHPILSAGKSDGTVFFRFYSRLDPSWNDLVWSGSFPELVYALLYENEIKTGFADSTDKRIIDYNQLLPGFTQEAAASKKPISVKTIDLGGFCWLLILLLFFTERIISLQYYKKING